MTNEQRKNIELVKSGFANGISSHLAKKQLTDGEHAKLTQEEKQDVLKLFSV